MSTLVVAMAALVAVVAAVRGTWSPCGLSMVSAINPLAERARGHRYALTCAWFVAGAVLGGLALGGVLALLTLAVAPLSIGSSPLALGVGAAAALVCLASDLGVGPRLPGLPRQVNERWLTRYRRWVYAVGFGAQIACGFSTYVMTAANYLLVVLAPLTGEPWVALALGVGFGVVRGLAVLLTATVHTPAALLRLHAAVARWEPGSMAAATAVESVAAVALAAAAGALVGDPYAAVFALTSLLGVVLIGVRRPSRQERLGPSPAEPDHAAAGGPSRTPA